MQGAVQVGSGRDAAAYAFHAQHAPGGLDGFVGGDGEDVVHHRTVENLGHETGSYALNAVGRGGASGQHGRFGGLHGGHEGGGVGLLEASAHAADRGPRTHARHKGVHVEALGGGFLQNFHARLRIMHGRTVGVVELVGAERPPDIVVEEVGLILRALHALLRRGKQHFGSQGPQQHHAFAADRGGHGQDEADVELGAHHGQPDAQVAAGGFHDAAAARQLAALHGALDVGARGPVLDGPAGVARFEFDKDVRAQHVRHALQADQGGMSDAVEYVHQKIPLWFEVPFFRGERVLDGAAKPIKTFFIPSLPGGATAA